MTHDLFYLAGVFIWGVITMYFKLNEVQKTQARDKADSERDLKGLGNKIRRVEIQIMNDRAVDIAGTKEEPLRQWKAGLFKEEIR